MKEKIIKVDLLRSLKRESIYCDSMKQLVNEFIFYRNKIIIGSARTYEVIYIEIIDKENLE